MPFTFAKSTATADESCTVEDALSLLEFLLANPGAKVDLGPCATLHTAVLQVLLAVKPKIIALPREAFLRRWLSPALAPPVKRGSK
ncbi:MAG: hypothetical protein K9H25_22765 [Rhodospirillum sp.]|nr:hypothetical protein [Rhodospirillum sp.]MCF8502655.1 hypothetical protein [Rhodospirillum sp.]